MSSYKPKYKNVFFVGVGGTGMSALAQFQVMSGGTATGSDRAFDNGSAGDIARMLSEAGVDIAPQDGAALTEDFDAVVVSSAIEDTIPEIRKARRLGIPVIHRSEYLADITRGFRTISVAGTSGKSTVAAMVFEILDYAGLSPSLINGANLVRLEEKGLVGNCFHGNSGWLVIEADESDGTIVRYSSAIGVLLNMDKDHKETDELRGYFSSFKSNSSVFVVNGDKKNLEEFAEGSLVFKAGEAGGVVLEPAGSSFRYKGVDFFLPAPGFHNIENAAAAVTACEEAGVSAQVSAEALKCFKGVGRRFQAVGVKNNIRVIDDYAHNPVKIAAAIDAARLGGSRVLAFFQPHGYGPTRFMRNELIESFSTSLNEKDILWISEIFYAGGSVVKDITSEELVRAIAARGIDARFVPDRQDARGDIASSARPGDTIIVMGAREHTLHRFAEDIFASLG